MKGRRDVDWEVLKALAGRGALHKRARLTSKELAEDIDVSQQAVSASLIRLQARGLVERNMAARGQSVRITSAGTALLRTEYQFYKGLFEAGGPIEVIGTVVDGLGEGRYYLSRPGYRRALTALLGRTPYEGTLNLRLHGRDQDVMATLRASVGSVIAGFEEDGRTFGPIKCFRADIGGVQALVVLPERTHHSDVIELVAGTMLRSTLGLSQGSAVTVKIYLH